MEKTTQHEQGKWKPIDFRPPQPDDNWPYREHPNNGNDPQYGVKSPKFERHIFILRDQLLFDVDAQISMMSKARRKDDGTEDDAFSNATTQYKQQFFRWMDKHLGIAKGVMSAFVLEKFRTTKTNTISQNEEVDVTLLMPEWYDDTVFEQLCQAVHDYVVNATLFEFFSIALLVPTRYSVSNDPVTILKQQQMNDALDEIRKLVNASKPGRIRKPYKPF